MRSIPSVQTGPVRAVHGIATRSAGTLVLLGAAGLVATAAIHFAEAPGTFEDGAYLGISFIAQGIAALVAAVLAIRGSRLGILTGFAVAAASIGAYAVSRTIGLPGQSDEIWLEPTGLVAIVSESLAVVTLGVALLRDRTG
ncbi:MAG: hypothetical protein ACYC65_03450 [Candidatus Limnocylindrales bacterium]